MQVESCRSFVLNFNAVGFTDYQFELVKLQILISCKFYLNNEYYELLEHCLGSLVQVKSKGWSRTDPASIFKFKQRTFYDALSDHLTDKGALIALELLSYNEHTEKIGRRYEQITNNHLIRCNAQNGR